MGAFNQFLINERFTIPISTEELDNKLLFAELEDYDVEGIGDNAYQFIEKPSRSTEFYLNRTKILLGYSPIDKHLTEVLLYTNLSWGLIALAIGEVIALLAFIINPAPVPWEIYPAFPLLFIVAWYFIRLQEYVLLQKVIKYLSRPDLPLV